MQSLIIISIFISYLLLRIVKEDSEQIKFDRVSSIRWQDRLYKNTFVKMIVDAFKTKEHTRKYRRETEIIKNTNSYLTIEWLYVNKITAAVVTFILSLINNLVTADHFFQNVSTADQDILTLYALNIVVALEMLAVQSTVFLLHAVKKLNGHSSHNFRIMSMPVYRIENTQNIQTAGYAPAHLIVPGSS